MGDEHRPIVHARKNGLVRSAQITAPLKVGSQLHVVWNVCNLLGKVAALLASIDRLGGSLVFLPLLDALLAGGLFEFGDFRIQLRDAGGFVSQVPLQVLLDLRPFKKIRRLGVGHSVERFLNGFDLFDVAAKFDQLVAMIRQHALRDRTDEFLRHIHHVGQRCEGDLRFDHPKLGEMTSRFAFFRAKSRTKAVDLSMGHARRFEIELTRLSEINRVAEVVDLKQGLSALAGRRSENRRVNQHVATIVVESPNLIDDRRANAKDVPRSLGPKPQVTVLHQKLDAVRLGCDGIITGYVNDL